MELTLDGCEGFARKAFARIGCADEKGVPKWCLIVGGMISAGGREKGRKNAPELSKQLLFLHLDNEGGASINEEGKDFLGHIVFKSFIHCLQTTRAIPFPQTKSAGRLISGYRHR
jgi:hypothetical protein